PSVDGRTVRKDDDGTQGVESDGVAERLRRRRLRVRLCPRLHDYEVALAADERVRDHLFLCKETARRGPAASIRPLLHFVVLPDVADLERVIPPGRGGVGDGVLREGGGGESEEECNGSNAHGSGSRWTGICHSRNPCVPSQP